MRLKIGLLIIAGIFVQGLFLNVGFCSQEEAAIQKEQLYESLEIFSDAISIINKDFVDKVTSKDLIYGALKGMLSSLDPYSQFMDPETYKEMKVSTEGEFGGVGIVISIRDNLLTVISPILDTPAYKAGIKANDKILRIDKESTKDITLLEAVKKLRGQPNTSVELTLLRESNGQLLEVTIVRDIIKVDSIKKAEIIKDGVGYIRLIEFQERSREDFEKELERLEGEGMKGLIIDLRNNPGGLLDTAVEIADLFLPEGKIIVSTKGRYPLQDIVFKSHKQPAHLGYPLIVLVNEGSASGSEILAGALRDNKRALLVGTKTFGKGSVQTIVPLADGSALRVTTSKYYLPSGESIHEKGIVPDVEVDVSKYVLQPKEETKDVFKQLEKEAEEIKKPEAELETEEEKKPAAESLTEEEGYDIQLERAVDLMKGIMSYESLISAGKSS